MPKITSLTAGTPLLSDVLLAVDTSDPTMSVLGTTKKYNRYDVDNQIFTLASVPMFSPAIGATTANLNATYNNGSSGIGATLTNAGTLAVFTTDGNSYSINDPILVKNQSTAAQNGLYTITALGDGAVAWVLTRSTSADQAAELTFGKSILIVKGVTNGTKTFQLNFTGSVTVGSTSLTFSAMSFGTPPYVSLNGSYSLGGILYSTATQASVLAGTATANQMLQSGSSAAPAWSTATWPATTVANQLLYSSSNNVVTGLGVLARSILTTNSSSVPTYIALTDGQIVIGSSAGSPAAASLTAGTNIAITNSSNGITVSSNLFARTAVSSSPYHVLTTDYFLEVNTSSARSILLPNAPTIGTVFIIKDASGSAGSNNITISTVGGLVLIDTLTSYSINSNDGSIGVMFNGTKYLIW